MAGIVTGAVIVGGASLLGGVVSSIFGARSASRANELAAKNMEMQNKIAQENLKFQKEEAAKLEKQKYGIQKPI
jgi:outer membrane murein-binding lipoprotein Lpp